MFTHGPHRDHTSRTCKGCRYWSEMVAQYGGSGPNGAMCLNQESERFSKYQPAAATCANWRIGHLGAVDEPGSTGDEYQLAAKVSRYVSSEDRCDNCVHLTRETQRPNVCYCAEAWPGEDDGEGTIVACPIFVLRGSARDTGSTP